MKFYVYAAKVTGAKKVKFFREQMRSLESDGLYDCIGTVTLVVEPPMKEVVKEITPILEGAGWGTGLAKLHNTTVPINAYDVKVTYKVRE